MSDDNYESVQNLYYKIQDQSVRIERLESLVHRLEEDLRMVEFNRRHNR